MSWLSSKHNPYRKVNKALKLDSKHIKQVRKSIGLTAKNKWTSQLRRSLGLGSRKVVASSVPTSAAAYGYTPRRISTLMGGV